MNTPAPAAFTLERAVAADFEALHALRLRAMRSSLERLGRYDEARARERLAESFRPEHTQHIVAGGRRVGFIVLTPLSHALRLNHLYIDPAEQGRGLGSQVLRGVCEDADRLQQPVELCVLKRSEAGRFYARHGFVATGEGEWDVDHVRMPVSPSACTVRALWAAFQARDWAAARALLKTELQVTWWASGERFLDADGYIEANARYPEGWTIHVLEVSRLEDGRVLSVVRVDHPPAAFFATSFYRVDDGLVIGIDEYWATLEPPPAWRDAAGLAGRSRFDVLDDPRGPGAAPAATAP